MNEILRTGQKLFDQAAADPRQEFGSFFLSRFLGLEISYEPDACIVAFEALPALFNPQGTLHGGVLSTALDISMGHLLNKRSGPGATLEMKVQYLAPVAKGKVTCRASFLRYGARLSFIQSQATDAEGNAVAYATATWKSLASGTAKASGKAKE